MNRMKCSNCEKSTTNPTLCRAKAWRANHCGTRFMGASGGSSGARRTVPPHRSAFWQGKVVCREVVGESDVVANHAGGRAPARLISHGNSQRQLCGKGRDVLRAIHSATRRRRFRSVEWRIGLRVVRQRFGHRRSVRLEMIAAGRRCGCRPDQLDRQEKREANQLTSEWDGLAGAHLNVSHDFCRASHGSGSTFCRLRLRVAIADFSKSPDSVARKPLA